MKALVTGSSGHLGEALVRHLRNEGAAVTGVDIAGSDTTDVVGSVADQDLARASTSGVDVVYHTATLHKPHVATHSKQAFVETNVTGTLALLEAALAAGVRAFVFTSTTSVFGDAMRPARGDPAVWVTEDLAPQPRNIYGATKLAAEGLCRLFHRNHGLNCIVLRTSRFFPEADDDPGRRRDFVDANLKVNEFLYRRVDVGDVVSAHLAACARAEDLGFGIYIVSATSPFRQEDLAELARAPARVVERYVPHMTVYDELGWTMPDSFDRVYVNTRARADLGWVPQWDFGTVLDRVGSGHDWRSVAALGIGSKGYHNETFDDLEGPFPVE